MKTNLILAASVLTSVLFCGSRIEAQFAFVTNNGSITITGYTGPGGNVAIPSATNGYPVTAIGANAFFGLTNVTGVTIPDSVISIGGGAFNSCTALANVTIGNQATSIGDSAFYFCPGLTSVTIPDSVTNLGIGVFDECGLTNVMIGNSVTSLGVLVFKRCHLTSVTIPNSVTSIGDGAFYQCQSLTSVTIGNGLSSIADSAFEECFSLTNIAVNAADPAYASAGGVLFDKTMTTLILFPPGLAGGYVVPSSVTSIGDQAFNECPGPTSVTIGSGVTNIGSFAFNLCFNLNQVYFQGNAPSVDGTPGSLDGTVFNSDIGTAYYVPGTTGWGSTFGGWPTAPWYPFTFVTNNGSITITGYTGPDSNVTIPSSIYGYPVTAIGTSAFSGLTNLTGVTIPDGITNIGAAAFSYCLNLMSVTIPDSVIRIDYSAFENCTSLANVTIGDGVTSIDDGAFYYCPALTSVTIPNSVISIGSDVFDEDSGLTNATIGNSVTSISDGAFRDCTGLTSVTIPNSATSIGIDAFYRCQNLASVTIGSGVTNIDFQAFQEAYQLTNIAVNPANPSYASADGVLFDKAMTTLIRSYRGFAGGYVVPEGVTTISAAAFQDCPHMTSVTIPNSVTSIGDFAFGFCYGLGAAYFQGNAPLVDGAPGSADDSVFYFDSGTVYYLPGTTGWGATFGGWPTAAWYQPQPQIHGMSMQGSGFHFTVSWATNTSIIIEACTNLASPVWKALATNSLVQGTNYFSDPQWTGFPRRFYRATPAP